MSQSSFTLPAYAKINWTLHVLGRRADGYHELRTIVQTITLHDSLTFTERSDSDFKLTSDEPSVPADESNLVWRAAACLRERYNVKKGAHIHLEKRIPAEGGLGGGSSDAAVALAGLAHLWRLETSADELARLGAGLGADVPFFFTGGTALGRGLGTEITPLRDVNVENLLIVTPAARVSTAYAYKALNRSALTKESTDIILSISRAEARFHDSLHEALHNDFERVVYQQYPEVGRARARLVEHGARGALLAGSGASVFGIFESREALEKAHVALAEEQGWRVFACATLGRAGYRKALGSCGAFLRTQD